MAISETFLKLFKNFATNYKFNGTPTFFTWSKEQNHTNISTHIDELLQIISKDQQSFHDASIIESLNTTVLLSARTNPYLLECWIDFLNKYNAATKTYAPFDKIQINVSAEGKPSERMLGELQSALRNALQASVFADKAHQTETEILKKQIEELEGKNKKLLAENTQLQQQVADQTHLKSLNPNIETAQKQVGSLLELLSSLHEAIKDKPKVQEVKAELVEPTREIVPSAKTTSQISETALPTPPKELLVQEGTIKTGEVLDSRPKLKTAPPPPPPPKKEASATKEAPATNQKFFVQNKNLLDDINSALEKMKAKKGTVEKTDDSEKKKSMDLLK